MDIQPEKQNLDRVFSNTTYYIDFYQRDYKWTDEPVRRLLDDVFFQFEESYNKLQGLDPNEKTINANYPWYYLNTYVTNTVDGRVFVVDGQQRLTTLTLSLIALHGMAKQKESKTQHWLERKVAGYAGVEYQFWMHHEKHIGLLQALMNGVALDTIESSSGATAGNMLKNFRQIDAEFKRRLSTLHKFETFVYYFLYRLVLINLSVESKHVPMVFEVINDRGVRLRPYEILKGKLLGQIDKLELDAGGYNDLWDEKVAAINAFRENEIDSFFRYWLKAKFANNRKDGQRFDGDYHREMFKSEMNSRLKLDHAASEVKAFLKKSFSYYASLYARLLAASQTEMPQYPAVFFNDLNELDSQHMLILSACKVDDPEETEKISLVAAQIDRLSTLLRLQGAYESNSFNERLFEISAAIRDKPLKELGGLFDQALKAEITERRNTDSTQALSYALFKPTSIDRLSPRFTRYFFARVDAFLADGMRVQLKHKVAELVTARGAKTGFHIEHIFSRNEESLAAFQGDEDRLEAERNRLGAVLLLKGKDNISSSNERYADKLESYSNSLYWNITLRADTYKSKLDFKDFMQQHKLHFKPYDSFGPEQLEERHRLLFDLAALIWNS
jgi:Protein of unknown function DUF262/Protein of unknown function (DUF1524)